MLNLLTSPQLAFITALTWVRSRFDARDETGATAVEYGLMVALIAAVIVVGVTALGKELNNLFKSTCQTINAGTACP